MAKKDKKKDKKGKKGKGKGKKRNSKRASSIQLEKRKSEQVQVPSKPDVEEPCITNCAQETVSYRPNSYPGLLQHPRTMSVVGSECGTYESLCKLIYAAFRCADRIYMMVPWGNYVLFRWHDGATMNYFLFDGCTCNVNRFRYMDLTCGTAGLLFFKDLHRVINYLIMSRERREEIKRLKRSIVDDVCKEMYGEQHI